MFSSEFESWICSKLKVKLAGYSSLVLHLPPIFDFLPLTKSLFFYSLAAAVLSPLGEENLFPEYYRQEVAPSPSARNRRRRYKTKPTYIHPQLEHRPKNHINTDIIVTLMLALSSDQHKIWQRLTKGVFKQNMTNLSRLLVDNSELANRQPLVN